jgi:hypothetical protein
MPRDRTEFRPVLKYLGAFVALASLVWLYSVLKNALPAVSTAPKAPERAAVAPLREKPTPVGALPGAERTSALDQESASPPVEAFHGQPGQAETPISTAPVNSPSLIPTNAEKRIPGVHHLGRHNCDGELVFTDKDFRFSCPSDSFTVERNMVAKLDNNGVVLISGEKYHFEVAGYDKTGVHILFSEWLER